MLKKGTELQPHQQEMVSSALRNNGRLFILASVGSGKTLGTIASTEALAQKEQRPLNFLVIVPAALRSNFEEEVKKWTNDSVTIWYGRDKHVKTVKRKGNVNYNIISYELFRENPDKYLQTPDGKPIDGIISDEIHRAKNFDSLTARALMYASPKVKYFIGLTGTASSNTPAELVPVMMAVTGKKFPVSSPQEFKQRFLQKVKKVFPDGSVAKVWVLKDIDTLRKVFKDNIYYLDPLTQKLDMPGKVVEWVPVKMSPLQEQGYKYVMGTIDPITRLKIERGIPVTMKEAEAIVTKLIRAQQISNSIHVVDPKVSLSEAAEQTPKIKKILDDVEQHLRANPKGEVLIFTNNVVGGVDVIAQGLKDRKIKFGVYMGKGREDVPAELQRQEAADAYNKGKIKVLILSPAGAEGLSFPNTTFVAIADPHYNPERILQMEARGVRLKGLSYLPPEQRKVIVRRYYTVMKPSFWSRLLNRPVPKTLEEWKYTVAINKNKLNQELREMLRSREDIGKPIQEAPSAATIKLQKEPKHWWQWRPGWNFRKMVIPEKDVKPESLLPRLRKKEQAHSSPGPVFGLFSPQTGNQQPGLLQRLARLVF